MPGHRRAILISLFLSLWTSAAFCANSAQRDLDAAIKLIDAAKAPADLAAPQAILEKLVARESRFEPAYIELARVAMKTNWNPDGLHQAELLLDSALKIRPDSVNAKILLGYVYTNQLRFPEAEALFADAARSNPPNLWLWTNWGECLFKQGKVDEAIPKYRKAIEGPNKRDTYARARKDAYERLIFLLTSNADHDGVEAIYKQRIQESTPKDCVSADYAYFLLVIRGDPDRAIAVVRKSLDAGCKNDSSREVMGVASYAKWAASEGNTRFDALNQARIYLPAGAYAFFLLARQDLTIPAARELIRMGESVDQKDNDKMTALGHALRSTDVLAVERLIALGADPTVAVGYEEMPAALLPVLYPEPNMIKALQRAGVDYSKIRFNGMTAVDMARGTGDESLLRVLSGKPDPL